MTSTSATARAASGGPSDSPTAGAREPVLWLLTAGLLVGGIVLTTMSLTLPTTDELLLARIFSTSTGVLFTSLSAIVASYVLTRTNTVEDVEKKYMNVLDGVARSLAHIYSELHQATAQRRSNAYAHEETYQETVLMSASSVLAQFDSVTRLSGSISGAFKESKNDLDEIRSMLFVDASYSTTVTAAKGITTRSEPQQVAVKCPSCGSRVGAGLAMQAGWSSSVKCSNCGSRFNIHRKADLTVYTSPPKNSAPTYLPTTGDGFEGAGQRNSPANSLSDPPPPLEMTCPSCKTAMSVHFTADQVAREKVVVRICSECADVIQISATERSVKKVTPGQFASGDVIGRSAAYAKVLCPTDSYPLVASYQQRSTGNWIACCVTHTLAIQVTRAQIRDWMSTNDPDFLAARLALEADGGRKILTPVGKGGQ
jgi:transcription elongation factor Elf1